MKLSQIHIQQLLYGIIPSSPVDCSFLHLFYLYLVADVQCTFSTVGSDIEDLITATLKRPAGFKGIPMFADDRIGVKEPNPHCIISRDTSDEDDRTYSLRINDFKRCGVLKRNVRTLDRYFFVLLCLCLSSYNLGICSRTHLVPSISRRCYAI